MPGCTGKTDNDIKTDFCVRDIANAQTSSPGGAQNREPAGTLTLVGNQFTPSVFPLGRCEGDCDEDLDVSFLVEVLELTVGTVSLTLCFVSIIVRTRPDMFTA